MKSMPKFPSLLLLVTLLLGACSPAVSTVAPEATQQPAAAATDAPAQPTATQAPAATEVPPTSEPAVELTYTYPGAIPTDLASVEAALSEVTLAKFNATIKLNPVDWGAYTDKVNLMVAAGETCDVLFVAPWMNPSYSQLVSNGALYPLNDILETAAPEMVKAMPAGAFDATKINGNIYGVPNQQIWVKPFGPAIRVDLAEKYSFDVSTVSKLEDLEPFLAAVKAGEADVFPASGGSFVNELFGWDPIVTQDAGVVVRYDDKSLTVINAYEAPEFKAHVELMRKWYEAGYFPKDTVPGEDFNATWKAGKYGASLLDVIKPGLTVEFKNNRGYDVETKALAPVFTTTGSITATMNAVCQNSTSPEKALMFLNLLNTDPAFYNILAKGVEGKQWVWTDQAAKIIGPGPEKDAYNPGADWMFGNTFNAYFTDADTAKYQAETAEINANAVPSVALGFTFNPEPVKNELAQVTAVVTERGKPLFNGEVDPAKALPEFLQALKDAGIEKIIAEAQTQLNAFAGK